MKNKDKVVRMYSEITPPEATVKKCLECMQSQRVGRFPVKKVLILAACITLLMAMLVTTVGASKLFSAYDSLDEYSKTLPYPEKQGADNSLLNQSSAFATGEKVTAEAQGLKINAQKIYYDGTMVCISFVGEYDGEYKEAFRFDYTDTEKGEEFLIDGENVSPMYSASFYMLRTEDRFSGMLRLPFDSEKDKVSVEITIPYLQASDEEDNVLGELYGAFNFNLTAEKSKEGILTYSGNKADDEIYIHKIVSSSAGLKLTYFVPNSISSKAEDADIRIADKKANIANIQPIIVDGNGNPVKLIEGRVEMTEGGKYHIWRCEATTADTVDLTLYDKNDTDGCGQTPCVVAEFSDIIIK